MSTEPENDAVQSPEVWIELARLAHDSFKQRRKYEWKMHFGFWAAIAVVVYAAATQKISVFGSVCEGRVIGFSLWGSYLLHFVMVSQGHWKDKQKKHYYMSRAEGTTEQPKEPLNNPPRGAHLPDSFSHRAFRA